MATGIFEMRNAADQIAISFHNIGQVEQSDGVQPGEGEVCLVQIRPSPKPRFVTESGKEAFYIRTGNATNALTLSEYTAYLQTHWTRQEDATPDGDRSGWSLRAEAPPQPRLIFAPDKQ